MEESASFPLPQKYAFVNRRYRFSNQSSARSLNADYPLQRCNNYKTCCRKVNESFSALLAANRPPRIKELPGFRLANLPDVILLKVFKYSHPLDLVHCFSTVCKRWNSLVKSSAFYKEVRVVLNERSLFTGSAKLFLKRGRNLIKKLCINYQCALPPNEIAHIFSESMPSVTVLDFGYSTEIPMELIERLPNCFPNVVTFRMDYIEKLGNLSEEEMKDKNKREQVLDKLFSSTLFPKLRNLRMSILPEFCKETLNGLSSWQRSIEVVHLSNVHFMSDLHELARSFFAEILTELYLCGRINKEVFPVVGLLKNLRVMFMRSCLYAEDRHLACLKHLNKIESLMIECSNDGCFFSRHGIEEFLSLPAENKSSFFPYNLKHLAITRIYSFQDRAAIAIIKNCPGLESLNLTYNRYMSDESLRQLAKNLKKLRFLDISYLGRKKCELLCNLSNDDLPCLKFLRTFGNEVDEKILQKFNLRRPNMIISTRENFFVNWRIQGGVPIFSETFDGDINSVNNDLQEEAGFRIMGEISQ